MLCQHGPSLDFDTQCGDTYFCEKDVTCLFINKISPSFFFFFFFFAKVTILETYLSVPACLIG